MRRYLKLAASWCSAPVALRLTAFTLVWLLALGGQLPLATAALTTSSATYSTVSGGVVLPQANKVVSLTFRTVSLANAFRGLARVGGFNIMIDDSVEGLVTMDLTNVTVGQALEALRAAGDVAYGVQGNTVVVAARTSPKGQALQRTQSRVFTLKHSNPRQIATLLNQTVFLHKNPLNAQGMQGGGQGSQGAGAGGAGAGAGAAGGGQGALQMAGQTVTPDFYTNSIVVMGDAADMTLAEQLIPLLDQPREMRTWRLSHANAVDVATVIASSLFSDGPLPSLQLAQGAGGGGGGGGQGGGGGGGGQGGDQGASAEVGTLIQPSWLKTQGEKIEEGAGSQQVSSGAQGGGVGRPLVLRNTTKQEEMLMVNPTGAIIIPDARLNSLTILGTAQQLERVAQFLPTLDRPLPQIAFEVAVMELTDVNTRTMETALNGQLGELSGGFNAGGGGRSVLDYTNNPIVNSNDLAFAVEALIQKNRIRLLANPSMTTLHDHEAIINIVDEVVQGFEQVVDVSGNSVALVPRLGNAGIILNLLPKLGPEGVINLRISPTVSFPQPSPFNDGVTLISRREILAQSVNLKDGQSFVLGGLIQDLDSTTVSKLPFLGDLPIVGALLRSTRNDSRRSELLITITPHLLKPGQAALPAASQVPADNRGQAFAPTPALRSNTTMAMPKLTPMPSYLAPANGQGGLRPVGSAESDTLKQGVLGKYAAPANTLY